MGWRSSASGRPEGPDAKNTDAKNTLYYILAFPNVEAQKKSWQEFRSDPEWVKVKADSEKDGALVSKVDSTNLNATDYSPLGELLSVVFG